MLPNIAWFHPQVVHFVIGILIVGVAFRLVALTGRMKWTGPAATALLVIGACASWVAVKSGTDAHGPVERVPGSRDAVMEHEEKGKLTRNIFLGVAALELISLAFGKRPTARIVRMVSGVAGIAGVAVLYETAEHGGDLVYSYAGGIGLRTGDTADISRLYLAGLYHEAQKERRAGNAEGAAALTEEMAHRFPNDSTIRVLAIESQLRDRKNPTGTLAALDAFVVPSSNRRLYPRLQLLRADALVAAGQKDSARTILQALATATPPSRAAQAKLDSLK
jgi:uncharacterized membrane protein